MACHLQIPQSTVRNTTSVNIWGTWLLIDWWPRALLFDFFRGWTHQIWQQMWAWLYLHLHPYWLCHLHCFLALFSSSIFQYATFHWDQYLKHQHFHWDQYIKHQQFHWDQDNGFTFILSRSSWLQQQGLFFSLHRWIFVTRIFQISIKKSNSSFSQISFIIIMDSLISRLYFIFQYIYLKHFSQTYSNQIDTIQIVSEEEQKSEQI